MARGGITGGDTGDSTGDATGGSMGDDDRRWLSYRELGQALGIKSASAKRLSFRRRWPHRAGNDGLARVGVPVAELHRAASRDDSGTVTGAVIGGVTGDNPDGSAALALALDRIEALAGQAGHARAEVARLRAELATAESAAEASARHAAEMQAEAVDAWRTAAALARRLPHPAPVPTPRQRWGWLGRLRQRG